jgi:hypothetical protein
VRRLRPCADCGRTLPIEGRDLCRRCYRRARRDPSWVPFVVPPLRERLLSRLVVTPGAECLLWTGSINSAGYGVISVNGRYELVHRVMFEMFDGPIPEGLQLDHVRDRGCMHRHCANVSHLEPVTSRENTRRGDSPAGLNAGKTRCPQGHEYDEPNTLRDKRGRRDCRQCNAKDGPERVRDRARRASRRTPQYVRARDMVIRVAQTSDSFTAMDIRGNVAVPVGNLLKATYAEGLIEPTGAFLGKALKSKSPLRVWRVTDLGREYQPTNAQGVAK